MAGNPSDLYVNRAFFIDCSPMAENNFSLSVVRHPQAEHVILKLFLLRTIYA
jgi:hypothetical protein